MVAEKAAKSISVCPGCVSKYRVRKGETSQRFKRSVESVRSTTWLDGGKPDL
jgi:hypothetical protein